MSVENPQNESTPNRGVEYWARPVSRIDVNEVPPGAININVAGRQVANPLQGFGQLWRKTYRVRLPGIQASPPEVMRAWKENFERFQPRENRFHLPVSGLRPNDVLFIDAEVPALPGTPNIMPVASGVMVLYADETSFTVITPQGFPESGWNTFSAFEDQGVTVAQVQSMARASDPLYEIYFRFLGSSEQQEKTWVHVLASLAAHFGVHEQVSMEKECLAPDVQWKQAGNIIYNAGIRTVFYKLGAPLRWAGLGNKRR